MTTSPRTPGEIGSELSPKARMEPYVVQSTLDDGGPKISLAKLASIWPHEEPQPVDDFGPEPPVLSDHAPEDEPPWVDDGKPVPKPEQKTTPQAGFNFRSLGKLMNEPEVPVDWLLDGLLVRGTVSLLTGKPKAGKSILGRGLALAVAQSRPFLGRTTTQGEVLYLCLEERCQDVRRDFQLMGGTGSEPLLIDDTAAPGITGLCAKILQRKPMLVVLDPLQRILRIEDGNSYAQTYNAFSPLI